MAENTAISDGRNIAQEYMKSNWTKDKLVVPIG